MQIDFNLMEGLAPNFLKAVADFILTMKNS